MYLCRSSRCQNSSAICSGLGRGPRFAPFWPSRRGEKFCTYTIIFQTKVIYYKLYQSPFRHYYRLTKIYILYVMWSTGPFQIQSVNSTALSPPSEAFAPRLVGEVTVGTGGHGRRHAHHHTRNETGKGERKRQPLATARHFSPLPRDDLLSHPKLEASVKPKVLHPLRRCVISPSHPLPKPRPLNFPPRTREMNWPDDAPRKSSSRNSQRAANFRNNRSAAYELRWNSLVTSMSSSRAPPFTPERHERRSSFLRLF